MYAAVGRPAHSLPTFHVGLLKSAPSGSSSVMTIRRQGVTIEQGGYDEQAALQMEAYRNRRGVSVKNGELSEDERNVVELIKFFAV